MMRPPDFQQRQQALNPTQSCIVQAPAGSGKTTLLTLRVLALLARVEEPEHILAITFTRKAAAEMAQRVLDALALGQRSEMPEDEQAQQAWQLARAVLVRDQEKAWQLLQNPNRLRIQTIDSFCASLARQMPVVSQFGAPMAILEKPERLYLLAARETISLMEDPQWSPCICRVMQHLDNQRARVEQLLAQMLARRDQWLRHVASQSDHQTQREELESALQAIRAHAVDGACQQLLNQPVADIQSLAAFAASHLDASHFTVACADQIDLQDAGRDRFSYLLGLAELLLTKEGHWRRQVTKNNGFPAVGSVPATDRDHYQGRKQAMIDLLDHLADQDTLRDSLHALRALPNPHYEPDHWAVIEALLTLLPVAVAQLKLVFHSEGSVDFCEMAHAADRALGEGLDPSDLALRLDDQIHHVLVDEFQDTSETQFELLAKLLAGWQSGDGRTLFLVGDPMQSIYRFRQAEVGLFLKARDGGIGPVTQLQSLRLQANFRSQTGLVDWVNQTFSRVLPEQDDIASGAIRYASSVASKPECAGTSVALHPLVSESARVIEAEQVCRCIAELQQQHPEDSIAILVSGRNALIELVPRLKAEGIDFIAQEIDPLGSQTVIKDLLSLTRAMLHLADRVAWLSILRAPWCGLSLVDLHALVQGRAGVPVWDLLQDDEWFASLDPRSQSRVEVLREALRRAFACQQRMPLRDWVHACWVALSGPACVESVSALKDAEQFFDLLGELDQGGDLLDLAELKQRVDQLYAAPQTDAEIRLQIMTIHKAKGLEFDHVLLPGLDRQTGKEQRQLLNWMERPRSDADETASDLLLAPIPATGEERDATSQYLRALHDEKARYEIGRLAYVAVTRAKKSLQLWFRIKFKNDQEMAKPTSSSLLYALWPALQDELVVHDRSEIDSDKTDQEGNATNCFIRYLSEDYVRPSAPEAVSWSLHQSSPTAEEQEPIEFEWVGQTARLVGVVSHHLLHRIGARGVTVWQSRSQSEQQSMVEALLLEQGIEQQELAMATQRVVNLIDRCLKDSRGQWVLNAQHAHQACEFGVSGVLDGHVVHAVLDRTFVDAEGIRWIIDYKTGTHEGSDLEAFLDQEVARYRAQLERYARLMRLREDRPIQLGLYYPDFSGWRSWAFQG